ncbi:MAG: DUF1629 domain-containing protein [Pedobacter sp.]|uniref:imm11 family protein n=1 Tax=Pedobacter sp. TaxID=1411316 RepID=UPI003569BC20
MIYYKLINALSEHEDAWDLGEILNFGEFEIKKMNTPEWENIVDKPIEIEIDDEYGCDESDFNLSTTGIQIISEKFRNLLTGDEAEFYPVVFTNIEPKQNYFALRISNFYDCVDEKKSEFEYWNDAEVQMVPVRENTYKSLNRFSIDSTKCGDARIFRILKYFPTIIVTEDLKKSFEELGITGLKYEKLG